MAYFAILCADRALLRTAVLDAVSYTHLDVYKRQEQINWFPGHLKHGRWEKNIEQAPDWNLSRDRFWATAMPVWEGIDKTGKKHQIIVGSYAELKELSGVEPVSYTHLDVYKRQLQWRSQCLLA